MKRKLLFFMLATMPAVTFATITGEDITRNTVLVQPDDLGTMAYEETNDYNTQASADLRYFSRNGSKPMTGDVDMDGYDIDDAGVANVDKIKMINPVSTAFIIEEMALGLSSDAKCGYSGGGDYIGADGGVGFYCVASSNTNNFDLTYLSTNNYIMIQSPLIATTSNLVEKITGYGLCTSDNDPVAGLEVGDNYITFAHSGTISRTDLVTYSRFGSKIASLNATAQYAVASVNLDIVGIIAVGGVDRNEQIRVLMSWGTDLTNPLKVEIKSVFRTDYPIPKFVDVRNYKNNIVLFGLYHTTSFANRRLDPRYICIKMDAFYRTLNITQ